MTEWMHLCRKNEVRMCKKLLNNLGQVRSRLPNFNPNPNSNFALTLNSPWPWLIRQSGPTSLCWSTFDWTMTKPDLISSFGTLWPLRNLKSHRLRSVFRLWSWQPTALNLSILLLCMHENRRRFESKNASHMALFSASRAFCFQWITRHNANYVQMPACPLCSISY